VQPNSRVGGSEYEFGRSPKHITDALIWATEDFVNEWWTKVALEKGKQKKCTPYDISFSRYQAHQLHDQVGTTVNHVNLHGWSDHFVASKIHTNKEDQTCAS
jgi:hypothetical protein